MAVFEKLSAGTNDRCQQVDSPRKDLLPLRKRQTVEVSDDVVEPKRMMERIPVERQRKLVACSEAVAAIRTLMNSQRFRTLRLGCSIPTEHNAGPEVQLGL